MFKPHFGNWSAGPTLLTLRRARPSSLLSESQLHRDLLLPLHGPDGFTLRQVERFAVRNGRERLLGDVIAAFCLTWHGQDYFYDWRPGTSQLVKEMEAEILEARIQELASKRGKQLLGEVSLVAIAPHKPGKDTLEYLDCCPRGSQSYSFPVDDEMGTTWIRLIPRSVPCVQWIFVVPISNASLLICHMLTNFPSKLQSKLETCAAFGRNA